MSYTLPLQISLSLINLPAIPRILTLMMDVMSPLNTMTPCVTTSLIPCLSLLFITPSLWLTSIKVKRIIPPTPMAGRHRWTTNLLLFPPSLNILRSIQGNQRSRGWCWGDQRNGNNWWDWCMCTNRAGSSDQMVHSSWHGVYLPEACWAGGAWQDRLWFLGREMVCGQGARFTVSWPVLV